MKKIVLLLLAFVIMYNLTLIAMEAEEKELQDGPAIVLARPTSTTPRIRGLKYESRYGTGASVTAALQERAHNPDEKNQALLRASKFGNTDSVAVLLGADASVHAYNKKGLTALHIAAKPAIVTLLLNAQADINAGNGTPLLWALHDKRFGVAKHLMENGAALNKPDTNGVQPIHVTSKYGKKRIVKKLLDAKIDINAAAKDGTTPLHCACESGQLEIVQLLLARKANVNAPSSPVHPYFSAKPGYVTPLFLAARTYWHAGKHDTYVTIMKELVAHGAHYTEENMMDYDQVHGRWGRYHIGSYINPDKPNSCQCSVQ